MLMPCFAYDVRSCVNDPISSLKRAQKRLSQGKENHEVSD